MSGILSKKEKEIIEYKKGKKLGKLFSKMTKCPVGNGSCMEIITMKIREYIKETFIDHEIWLCQLGKNEDSCILNK